MPPAADLAKRTLDALLANEGNHIGEYAKPMGTFVIRFSGKGLAHVGKAVDAALDRLLAAAGGPLIYRGFVSKGAKATRYDKPKRCEGAGRTLLSGAFATYKAMPKNCTMIYFKDGAP